MQCFTTRQQKQQKSKRKPGSKQTSEQATKIYKTRGGKLPAAEEDITDFADDFANVNKGGKGGKKRAGKG